MQFDQLRRREFITLLGGAAATWPLSVRALQTKVARIGFLGLVSASSHAARLAALRAGLRDRGWLEGTVATVKTTGRVEVAALAASAATSPPMVTMTATFRPTRSAANAASRP